MKKEFFFIALLMLGLGIVLGFPSAQAATFDVDMGNFNPPCGALYSTDIGFVDCTSNTGGIYHIATSAISAGDTVRWTMRGVPHTTTSETALGTPGGGAPSTCGTGDNFDSGLANAFNPSFVYTHTFSKPGTCAYFCIVHSASMQGQVIVMGPSTTTTTTTSTTTATTTTTTRSTTTTTSKPSCNDQSNGNGKGNGKGHDKGECKGHD